MDPEVADWALQEKCLVVLGAWKVPVPRRLVVGDQVQALGAAPEI